MFDKPMDSKPMDDMKDEKDNSVKCPNCGEALKLEKAMDDKMEKPMDKPMDKKPMAPKPNAAKMPMDSLKGALMNASDKPQPGM